MLMSHVSTRKAAGVLAAVGVVLACSAATSDATPIDYSFRTLADGVLMFDALSPTATADDPNLAHYWTFSGDLGDDVTISVMRLRNDYDPLFWVFEGLVADTDHFGGLPASVIDSGDPGYLYRQDDGPTGVPGFGFDPQLTFTLPSTNAYTVIVVNGPLSSQEAEGSFGYSILASGFENDVTPVPEASSALTLLAGLGALAAGYRRRWR
jgi:hypothetical protein